MLHRGYDTLLDNDNRFETEHGNVDLLDASMEAPLAGVIKGA